MKCSLLVTSIIGHLEIIFRCCSHRIMVCCNRCVPPSTSGTYQSNWETSTWTALYQSLQLYDPISSNMRFIPIGTLVCSISTVPTHGTYVCSCTDIWYIGMLDKYCTNTWSVHRYGPIQQSMHRVIRFFHSSLCIKYDTEAQKE